jgi:hypothetical protein
MKAVLTNSFKAIVGTRAGSRAEREPKQIVSAPQHCKNHSQVYTVPTLPYREKLSGQNYDTGERKRGIKTIE